MKKIGLVLCFLFNHSLWAQSARIDSLYQIVKKESNLKNQVDQLNAFSVQYKTKDFDTSKVLAEKALTIAEQENYPDGMAIAYRNMGIVATNQSNFELAFTYYNKALKLTKTPKVLGQLHGSLARTYAEVSNFDQSLDEQFKALQAFETCGDLQLQYITLYNISNTYIQFNNLEKYNEYKNKALAVKSQMENQSIVAPKTATPLHTQDAVKLDPKINHQTQLYSQEIAQAEQDKNLPEKAEALLKQAKINISSGQLKVALKQLEEALQLEQQLDNPVKEADIEKHLGDLHLELGKNNREKSNLQKAVDYYHKALQVFERKNQYLNAYEGSGNLSLAYALLGNFKQAYVYREKSMLFYELMFNSKSKESLKNIEDRYIIESKNKQLRIRELELENKTRQQTMLYLGLLALILIGGLLWFQSRQRQKANQKLQLLNQDLEQANRNKTRFFSILNHDLRAPVSNLIHFLHLQKENPDLLDDETKVRLEKKTITGAEDLLTSMEDILLWSKSQMEQFKPNLKPTEIQQIFNDTQKVFSGYINISFAYDIPENLVAYTDENCLKTIIRNLTSNAINAFVETEKPSIRWSAREEDHQIILTITDNGPGAAENQFKALYDTNQKVGIKSGLGLHLVRDLAKSIEAEIEVKSQIGQGTTIEIRL
ncbi:MAG: DUF5112 domain-containing protein [Flavobacteriaceae bacterium]